MPLTSNSNILSYHCPDIGCDESKEFFIKMENKSFDCKRLQDISLYSVILNFKAIMQEYYQTVDGSNKFKFRILQRYSKTLFECLLLLKEYVVMEEPYITFLINPCIRELDLTLCGPTNISGLLKALQSVGHAIISLNLSGMNWELKMLDNLLSLLPNLEAINLFCARISHYSPLGVIHARCPLLKTLCLRNEFDIGDGGLPMLCTSGKSNVLEKNHNIESLDITGAWITAECIMFALKYFPSLKELNHNDVADTLHSFHYDDLKFGRLEKVPKYALQKLHIDSSAPVAELLQICAVLCPDLTKLTFVEIDPALNEGLWYKFPHLKEVQFSFQTDENLKFLNEFFRLQSHSLEILTITSSRLCVTALSECSELCKLTLKHPVFENLDELLEPMFPCLTVLSISDIDLSDNNDLKCVLLILSSSPALIELTLDNTIFPNHAMNSIFECSCIINLTYLKINFNFVTVSSIVRVLLLAPKLRNFLIRRRPIPVSVRREISEMYPNIVRFC